VRVDIRKEGLRYRRIKSDCSIHGEGESKQAGHRISIVTGAQEGAHKRVCDLAGCAVESPCPPIDSRGSLPPIVHQSGDAVVEVQDIIGISGRDNNNVGVLRSGFPQGIVSPAGDSDE
jgi:hypothetical protein